MKHYCTKMIVCLLVAGMLLPACAQDNGVKPDDTGTSATPSDSSADTPPPR